ncbi:MAG: hypothetical protein ACRYGF_07585 [Janthinobacterium lividum]
MSHPSYDAVTVGQQCLQQIEALQQQLQAGMDAIARNSLHDFEQSLWQQEMLTNGMRRSLALLSTLAVDAPLLQRVRQASASLQHTSRSYQKLVDQSSRSATVLHDLCSLYQHAPVQAEATKQQALSCEA